MYLPIAIHKDPNSSYGVAIPDVVGCFSGGTTIEEAMENAQKAVYAHLAAAEAVGIPFEVKASSVQELMEKEPKAYAGAMWAYIRIDLAEMNSKTARINVSANSQAIERIDNYLKNRPENRSEFLIQSALAIIDKSA